MYNILVYNDANNYVLLETIKAFKKLGHNVIINDESSDNIDFIFSSNDIRPYVSKRKASKPIVTWISEYPMQTYFWSSISAKQSDIIFTTDQVQVGEIKKNCNLENVYFLPLATSFNVLDIKNTHQYPISFAGSSKRQFIVDMENCKDTVRKLPISPDDLENLKSHLVLKKDYFRPLQNIVQDDNFLKSLFDKVPKDGISLYKSGHLMLYMSMIITLQKRIDILSGLGMEEHLHLMPREWIDLVPGCQCHDRVEYDKTDLFFADSAINIDINSLHMPTVVNSRLFDVPLCGGFVITDYREGMYDLFHEDEIVCYKSIDDLKEKVDYYLKHPDDRIKIINRARKRILNQHMYTHRVQYIINMYEELYK